MRFEKWKESEHLEKLWPKAVSPYAPPSHSKTLAHSRSLLEFREVMECGGGGGEGDTAFGSKDHPATRASDSTFAMACLGSSVERRVKVSAGNPIATFNW